MARFVELAVIHDLLARVIRVTELYFNIDQKGSDKIEGDVVRCIWDKFTFNDSRCETEANVIEMALEAVEGDLASEQEKDEKAKSQPTKGTEQKILQPGISLNADTINVEQIVQSEIASLQSTHTIYNHVPEKKPWYKTIWAAIGGIILLLGGLGTVIQIRESGTFKQLVASLNKPQSASDPNAQADSNTIIQPSKPSHDASISLPAR